MSGATRFTEEMKIAAAVTIAGQTKLDDMVPDVLDHQVHEAVAQAVAVAWSAAK
jgi:malic enzyme